MSRKNIKDRDDQGKLSETDIERIVDTLWLDKRFKKEFEKRIKFLEDYLRLKLSKEIHYTAEDQAKLYAIAEIMKSNFYEKLRKKEEE
jgi:hypothetical protein